MFLSAISSTFPSTRSQIIDAYYHNYYLKNCNLSNFGYYDSWEFLASTAHWVSLFVIPFNFFGAYCILYQSPAKMKNVKWVMLNSHMWTSLSDVMLTSVVTPYIFFPAICGFPVGILAIFEVSVNFQAYLGQSFVTSMIVSIAMLFENRHNALLSHRCKIGNSTRYIYFTIHYLIGYVFLAPSYFTIVDQEAAKIDILEKQIPCPSEEFFEAPVFVFITNTYLLMVSCFCFALFVFSEIVFLILHSFYILIFGYMNSISKRTRVLQRKFLIAICIQFFIPFLVICIPITYITLSVIFNYYKQSFTNIAMLFISLHGLSSTIVLLLLNEPYRTFCKTIIGIREIKVQLQRKSQDTNKIFLGVNTDNNIMF